MGMRTGMGMVNRKWDINGDSSLEEIPGSKNWRQVKLKLWKLITKEISNKNWKISSVRSLKYSDNDYGDMLKPHPTFRLRDNMIYIRMYLYNGKLTLFLCTYAILSPFEFGDIWD